MQTVPSVSMPRLPRHQKSLQKLFVETVLFISLFALVGHLSVNFWERYMIQSELTKIKSSLYGMKDTINCIGNAYDNLHHELVGLVQIIERNQRLEDQTQRKKPKSKNESTLDRKTVHDLEVQVIAYNKTYNEQRIGAAPFTINQATQDIFQGNKVRRNATTIANCLHREAMERNMGISAMPSVHHKNEDAIRVIPLPDVRNATTITRYPVKATGVGDDEARYKEFCKYVHNQQHKCCNDDNCKSDFWRF